MSNNSDSRGFTTLQWIGDVDGYLELTDQRLLPNNFTKLNCKTIEQLFDAIKTLAVRGAPAIGVSAGYGVCIAAQKLSDFKNLSSAFQSLRNDIDYLATSRPTAVNLFWALNRMKKFTENFIKQNENASITKLQQALLTEANNIYNEDVEMCKNIGINGADLIPDGGQILTHCNAGALATAGIGTALAPIFTAHNHGKIFKVFVDETRPLLQGARLTAWELQRSQIEATLICDNMAGWLMKQGMIKAVITGADRIAANGDAANKIGTYSLSILAKSHGIPFYIAAPSSTFDLSIPDGSSIPIEQRDPAEVTSFGKRDTAPIGIDVYNPAFDVVDAQNITAIITEKAVIEKPNREKIAMALKF